MTSSQPDTLALGRYSTPWLVGYDAHGIQEFIAASNRPLAMLGASTTIAHFDAETAVQASCSIFAGGGRGIELVEGEAAARARCEKLSAEYARSTFGGAMSTAAVPLDRSDEHTSLRWLRQRLDLVKDACPRPGRSILSTSFQKSNQCADCGSYAAEHPSERRDANGERVCPRCFAMTRAGRASTREDEEPIQSLLDIVEPGEYIAAVSLDGNNLGTFFDGLDSLAATRDASRGLSDLFTGAQNRARRQIRGKCVSLATGGDDIRLFLRQSQVLGYLDVLLDELHTGADRLARADPFRGRLTNFGVGVGVVLADPHLPAKRLICYAVDLEHAAKRRCRPGQDSVRTALDFAVLTAGDATAVDPAERDCDDGRPIAHGEEWSRLLAHTAELARIPTSQLAVLRPAPAPTAAEFAEFANQWRYQVARSPSWQRWYERTDRSWRDPQRVVDERPRPVHLDLLHLVAPPVGVA